jgi:hypothetical protein
VGGLLALGKNGDMMNIKVKINSKQGRRADSAAQRPAVGS